MTAHPYSLTIRRATEADAAALGQLAELDEAPRLEGDVLLAELDGESLAALSIPDGAVTADPFRPTQAAVEILRMRADALRGDRAHAGRSRRRSHRPFARLVHRPPASASG